MLFQVTKEALRISNGCNGSNACATLFGVGKSDVIQGFIGFRMIELIRSAKVWPQGKGAATQELLIGFSGER